MLLHVRRAAKTVTYKDGRRENVLGETKTRGSVRDLRIPEFLAEPIADHLREFTGSEPDALLFPSPRNGGVCAGQTLRNAFTRAKEKVPALAGMRPHDLRDTALTRLAAMGATNGELMRQAGHQTLAVASKYQHTVESHYAGVLDTLARSVEAADGERTATTANTTAQSPEPAETRDVTPPADEATDGLQTDGMGELEQLAAVLAHMPLAARVDVLKGIPAERRYRILELLDTTAQVETMRELLREAA